MNVDRTWRGGTAEWYEVWTDKVEMMNDDPNDTQTVEFMYQSNHRKYSAAKKQALKQAREYPQYRVEIVTVTGDKLWDNWNPVNQDYELINNPFIK